MDFSQSTGSTNMPGKQNSEEPKSSSPHSEGRGAKRISWAEVCFDLAERFGRLPQEIWASFSFRQINGFYEIHLDRMVEEFKQNAALHGINPDDTSKGTLKQVQGGLPNTFDTRDISGDNWQKTAE